MEHYPMLCGWASVRVTGPNRAEVVNERTGESFAVEDRRRIVSYILRLDGYHIMNALLGEAEDIVEAARDSVALKHMRSELTRGGMTGKVKLCAYYLVIILQYVLPFAIIFDIGGLILWFR